METENAKIVSADLCFEEISGVRGRQFTLRLRLEVGQCRQRGDLPRFY